MKTIAMNIKNPWTMVESFDCPPELIFAELRTITWVIGNPPKNPLTIFPIPCAFNSWLVGVENFSGSYLSVASTESKVSKLPTKAIVMATT